MTSLTIPAGYDFALGCAGQPGNDGDAAQPSQPRQPGAQEKPHGEPAKPTDKPLPDLPNPSEVGEDG